jgi:hypothetical protein
LDFEDLTKRKANLAELGASIIAQAKSGIAILSTVRPLMQACQHMVEGIVDQAVDTLTWLILAVLKSVVCCLKAKIHV